MVALGNARAQALRRNRRQRQGSAVDWILWGVPLGLTVVAGILIIWRERNLGLERARQRKAMTPQG